MIALALLLAWIPSPAEEAAARHQALAAQVTAHLGDLPGVARASVVIAEPPAPGLPRLDEPPPAPHPSVSALLVLRPGASLPAAEPELRAMIAAAIPGSQAEDIQLVIAPDPAPPPDPLVSLGPFRVAQGSFAPLAATLGLAFVLVFVLGALLFRGERFRGQGKPSDRR